MKDSQPVYDPPIRPGSLVGIGARLAKMSQPPPETPGIETIARQIAQNAFHQRPHLDALASLLETAVQHVAEGGTRRIVVSMPPGLGKSQTCSVALPLHILAEHPDWNIGLISSEASLANKFSRDARRHAPQLGIEIANDVGQVTEWESTTGGGVIARGVGGALTGRRLKVLVMDDPVKDAKHAYSELERKNLWDWYQSVAKTRLAPASLALCVATRWHEQDLMAQLLEQGWEEFRLPALAETNDLLGREPGQPLLTPQAEETEGQALDRWQQTREEVGSMVWAGLYQQRPAPAEGSMFNADDLQDPPDDLDLTQGTWITSWDLSFGGSGDYTVGTVWQALNNGMYVLHDIIRGRWEFTQQLAAFKRTVARYPQCTHHLVEAAANGAAMVDTTRRSIPGVTPIKPLGGKVERWQAITPLMEAHKVATVGGAWLQDLRAEMVVAPNGAHDDQLDSLAQALNWLRVRRFSPPTVATTTVTTRLPGR
jgi:predicted phage terminase large subunit-like protein